MDATSPNPTRVWRPLAVAMVLQYAVGGAVLPFLTLLLRDRGWAFAQISWLLTAGSAALLVSPFFWGMLADRLIPLNRLLILMNLLAAVALGVLASRRDLVGLGVAFVAFYACFLPSPMLVNALALRHLRDPLREFGPLRAWGSLGWILPSLPVFLWLLLRPGAGFEFTLVLTVGFALAMAVAACWLPPTPPGALRGEGGRRADAGYWPALRRLLGDPVYLVVLVSYFLVSASFSVQAFYSPPRLEAAGLPRAWIGLVQSVGIVWEIALFLGRSTILNRIGQRGAVLTGCAALVLRQVLFAESDNLWVLGASYLLVGTTVVLYHIGISLMVERLAGREVKATSQTLLVLCSSGLGPMFANWTVGRLVPDGGHDLAVVFHFGAVLAGLAFLLLLARGQKLPG